MAIRIIPLQDTWALRRLTVCVRSLAELPAHAARLVEHLRILSRGGEERSRSTSRPLWRKLVPIKHGQNGREAVNRPCPRAGLLR